MSVAGHRVEGDRLIVTLRGGGVMTFDRGAIIGIAPDEVPYPEPAAIAGADTTIEPRGRLVETTSYDPLIERASSQHRLDPRLVKAVIQVNRAFSPGRDRPKAPWD